VMLNGRRPDIALSERESRVVDALAERPFCVHELAHRIDVLAWQLLPLARLEERHLVQRCALTPTDVLHATGRLCLWDADAARTLCDMFARLMGVSAEAFAQQALQEVVRRLAVELLKKQLAGDVDPDEMDRSPVARALVGNLLDGGSDGFRVRVALGRPVIGIGAPAHFFLPQAAELLETQAHIPPHADVANAIGAITSSVFIHQQVRISPNEFGRYALYGLPDAPTFQEFDRAHAFAVEQLKQIVRRKAYETGTRQTRVEIVVDDHVADIGYGGQAFVGRTLEARLSGRPDIARLASRDS